MAEAAVFSVAYAYVTPSTRHDDVEFYKSKRYTKTQLGCYLRRMRMRAEMAGITLLEVTVYNGSDEVYKIEV